MSVHYKYAPYVTKYVVLYYVDDCVDFYTSEYTIKLFVENLGKIFHVNFLGLSHCFMSISISKMKYHSISVDQVRYATSDVSKYLDTVTVKKSTKFYNTNFPYYMIFTKDDVSTSDDQVEKLNT